MYINFSDIPGQQNLFLDYLYEFENVKEYFNGRNFRDTASFEGLFQSLSRPDRPQRASVASIIRQQYASMKPSNLTRRNIEHLEEPNTIAVVTGQQLGIYGGPLYTFYKLITAIKLCNHLKEIYQDYNFVPVFWMEGDDHDFEEVRSFNILNLSNEIVQLSYDDKLPPETNRGSVGSQVFNSDIDALNKKLEEILRDNDFKHSLLRLLSSAYCEGRTFKQSFRQLLFSMFDEFGIVLFDPQLKEVKQLLKDIFRKEVLEFRKHTDTLVRRSARLDEIYHAQVKVNPVNLFYHDDDGRYLLEPVDDVFRLKGKRRRFTADELLRLIDSSPERFSPNVLLRPVCQDYLFPTAFYVAGPSEVSYFAQLIPLYEFFGVTQPLLYPRSSATILEQGIKNVLEKYNLTYTDLFHDMDRLHERVLKSLTMTETDAEFERTLRTMGEAMDSLSQKLSQIDKTLTDSVEKTREKMLQGVELLKNKAVAAEKKKHESMIRQLTKASNNLYPNSNLQERELNFIYFAHKYGLDFIGRLVEALSINKFEHQVIEI